MPPICTQPRGILACEYNRVQAGDEVAAGHAGGRASQDAMPRVTETGSPPVGMAFSWSSPASAVCMLALRAWLGGWPDGAESCVMRLWCTCHHISWHVQRLDVCRSHLRGRGASRVQSTRVASDVVQYCPPTTVLGSVKERLNRVGACGVWVRAVQRGRKVMLLNWAVNLAGAGDLLSGTVRRWHATRFKGCSCAAERRVESETG